MCVFKQRLIHFYFSCRHNTNDDLSSRSAPESPKVDGQRNTSRAHPQEIHHQAHHEHLSYGGRNSRDGGVGDPYQLHSGVSEGLNIDELVGTNHDR